MHCSVSNKLERKKLGGFVERDKDMPMLCKNAYYLSVYCDYNPCEERIKCHLSAQKFYKAPYLQSAKKIRAFL